MGKFVDKNFEMASVRKMPIQVEMPANIIFPAACILSSIGLELSHSTLTALPKERVASLIIITMRFTVVRVEFYSIVYEDEDIIVINKPRDLVVHPGAGNPDGTVLNALLHYYPPIADVPRAGIVHRLDKDTTGLMVVAKTVPAQTRLVESLQRREITREYEAVAIGHMTAGGTVDEPISRHPTKRTHMAVHPMGKPAVTHYRIMEHFRVHTRLRLRLETGRTHQIRVHMAHITHPLVGDPVYGGRPRPPKGASEAFISTLRKFDRQALHATMLRLYHPISGIEMEWHAPIPQDMVELIEEMRADFEEHKDEVDWL